VVSAIPASNPSRSGAFGLLGVSRLAPSFIAILIVYAVVDDALSPDFPLGDSLEVFVRREDAERFIDEVRGDEPEIAAKDADRGA
jgi:hypothetical protein